jgi:large subunit ribosomal protein L20
VRRANRKKLSKITKGFFLTKSKLYRSMKEAADKAGRYAFRDRRRKKRDFRRLWILRISAAARSNGVTYSQLIHGLHVLAIEIDRKMLAEMAVKDQHAFAELVGKVKATITEPQRVAAAS